ncbi:MAG TPA: sulfotransferase [Acetobacteraceae bacterium]|nr:sulfotransferase [Acetobacteraceae bacterium]
MMMQVLAAAGIPPHTDGARAADPDNPRGYFEHAAAMRLHQDTGWIADARGKAVKIIAPLLPYLPPDNRYRLVFMHRALNEVVASQRAMLQRLGRTGAQLDDAALVRAFTGQLVRVQKWLSQRAEIPVLAVPYAEAVADPDSTAARLAQFLGAPFDRSAASATVDAALRNHGH